MLLSLSANEKIQPSVQRDVGPIQPFGTIVGIALLAGCPAELPCMAAERGSSGAMGHEARPAVRAICHKARLHLEQHPSESTSHDPAAGGLQWSPVVQGLVPVIDTKLKEPAEQNSSVLPSAFGEPAQGLPAAWMLGVGCPGLVAWETAGNLSH